MSCVARESVESRRMQEGDDEEQVSDVSKPG
jgi:hypothetical protein